MALSQAQLGGLYQQLYNRPLGAADIAALGGANGPWSQMTQDQFIQQVGIPSQEFQTKYPGVNTIGGFQQAQAQNQAKAVFQPLVDQGQAANQQQFQALKDTIGLQKNQAENGLATTLSARGIGLNSSEFKNDTAQIENTAQTQLGGAAQTLAQADQTLQQWAQQNILSQASAQQQTNFAQTQAAEQQQFQQGLQTQAQNFSQWATAQGLNMNLFQTLPQSYQTLLTMSATPDQTLYNELVALAGQMGQKPPDFTAQ